MYFHVIAPRIEDNSQNILWRGYLQMRSIDGQWAHRCAQQIFSRSQRHCSTIIRRSIANPTLNMKHKSMINCSIYLLRKRNQITNYYNPLVFWKKPYRRHDSLWIEGHSVPVSVERTLWNKVLFEKQKISCQNRDINPWLSWLLLLIYSRCNYHGFLNYSLLKWFKSYPRYLDEIAQIFIETDIYEWKNWSRKACRWATKLEIWSTKKLAWRFLSWKGHPAGINTACPRRCTNEQGSTPEEGQKGFSLT